MPRYGDDPRRIDRAVHIREPEEILARALGRVTEASGNGSIDDHEAVECARIDARVFRPFPTGRGGLNVNPIEELSLGPGALRILRVVFSPAQPASDVAEAAEGESSTWWILSRRWLQCFERKQVERGFHVES